MPNNAILNSMLEKFDGCEGGDAGSQDAQTIWLFGIEPGWSKFDQQNTDGHHNPVDEGYLVKTQLQWPFNRNVFKLLAVINGYNVEQYRKFAEKCQPFVKGSTGYFKGNLFPYACNNVNEWAEDAARETGLASKSEYQNWCSKFRWPAIKSWVDEHQPKLFIGVGNSFREQFALAVYGRKVELENRSFAIDGYTKNIFCANVDGRRLVVIPHLSGGRNGLNSYKSIEQAGAIIKELMSEGVEGVRNFV